MGGRNLHDLLPLPYTEETVIHITGRIRQVQEILDRTILIENVSSYMAFRSSQSEEWEFLTAVAEEADCGILLDINNIFMSAFNHHFDPLRYIDAVPADRVMQFHLAGHSDHGSYLLDTHDHQIRAEVWALYEHAVRRFGRVPTLIEWDDEHTGLRTAGRGRCRSATPMRFSAGLRKIGRGQITCTEYQLQNFLYRRITNLDATNESLGDERGPAPRVLEALVHGDQRLSAFERVDTYANAYFYRLLECLGKDFRPRWQW